LLGDEFGVASVADVLAVREKDLAKLAGVEVAADVFVGGDDAEAVGFGDHDALLDEGLAGLLHVVRHDHVGDLLAAGHATDGLLDIDDGDGVFGGQETAEDAAMADGAKVVVAVASSLKMPGTRKMTIVMQVKPMMTTKTAFIKRVSFWKARIMSGDSLFFGGALAGRAVAGARGEANFLRAGIVYQYKWRALRESPEFRIWGSARFGCQFEVTFVCPVFRRSMNYSIKWKGFEKASGGEAM